MHGGTQLSVIAEEPGNSDIAVLRITSAAKNTMTQAYGARVQVSSAAIRDLDQKLAEKLRLHGIRDVRVSLSMQLDGDKTIDFASLQDLDRYDLKTKYCTNLLTIKWKFVFDSEDSGNQLHSVYVRVSERPNPGLLFQRVFSRHTEDLESLDNDLLAPIICKVDFFDGRFSGELLALVEDWVKALPRVEPAIGIANWLRKHDDSLIAFIKMTLPVGAILAYVGYWIGLAELDSSSNLKVASAWVLGGIALFAVMQYLGEILGAVFARTIMRLSNVPVFNFTTGDSNKISVYVAKTQKSLIVLAASALIYGAFQAIGLNLGKHVLAAIW